MGITTIRENEYFTLVKVGPGCYGAIEKKDSGAGSNAGILDLGDCTVIFDTFLNLSAAEELKALSLELTGREPAFVVNSHYHFDHVIGNQVFIDSTIIASKPTKAAFERELVPSLQKYSALESSVLEKLKLAMQSETNEDKRLNYKNDLQFLRNVRHPSVSLVAPSLTFEDSITLYGSLQSVELKAFPLAHAPGDVIAYIPQARVCYAGDLLFTKFYPWLGAGDPYKFIDAVEEILALDADYIVPGHGNIGTKTDLQLEVKYIKEMIALVTTKLDTPDMTITRQDLSPELRDWAGPTFDWNIRFLGGYLEKRR